MPLVYSAVEIEGLSETTEVADEFLRVIHGREVKIDGKSQADNSYLGRDRHHLIYTAVSSAAIAAYPFIRRHSAATINAETSAKCYLMGVIPAIQAPSGNLSLQGQPANGQRLPLRASHTFGFLAIGKRLEGLVVSFKLEDLSNRLLFEKTIRIDPGGVAIEDIIPNDDGTQTARGWVLMLPRDSNYLPRVTPTKPFVEVKYILEIGNKTTRKHILEVGNLTFYDT